MSKDIADEELAKQLDAEADAAAIQAKSNGRNRIEVARRLASEVDLRKASTTVEVSPSSGAPAQASAQAASGTTGPRAQRQWSRRSKIKAALAIAAVFGVLAGLGVLSTRTMHLGMAGCLGGPTPDKPPASGGTAAAGTGCPEGKEKALVYGEERCMPKAEKVPDCKDTNEAQPCCHYGKEACP